MSPIATEYRCVGVIGGICGSLIIPLHTPRAVPHPILEGAPIDVATPPLSVGAVAVHNAVLPRPIVLVAVREMHEAMPVRRAAPVELPPVSVPLLNQ